MSHATHAVFNQPPPLAEVNLFTGDRVLVEALRREGAEWAEERGQLERTEDLELRARRLVERLALALQASLLVRHAPPEVADAFCASRLAGDGGRAFGTLPAGVELGKIIERASGSHFASA